MQCLATLAHRTVKLQAASKLHAAKGSGARCGTGGTLHVNTTAAVTHHNHPALMTRQPIRWCPDPLD